MTLAGPPEQPEHQVTRALLTAGFHHGVERVEPLLGLFGIGVRELGGESVTDQVMPRRRRALLRSTRGVVLEEAKGSPRQATTAACAVGTPAVERVDSGRPGVGAAVALILPHPRALCRNGPPVPTQAGWPQVGHEL